MQIVKWNPQQRVDCPELTALSFAMLGEFRRSGRGFLLGGLEASYIISGFKAVASTVPDSIVTVKLDPGAGGALGFAIGAEDLGGGSIDYGHLIGGADSSGALEGNAQQTVDFTAQVPGTYNVRMTFAYSDSAADNRAFWDEGGNTEFIAEVDTRHKPVFSVAIGASSPGWIDLASVVWDGATVQTVDITDIRDFAMEGPAPFTVTDQDDAAAYPDFTRAVDRSVSELNGVYPALRALGRQVMDLKGQDDDGGFNWWGRTFSPATGAAGALPFGASQTKTLRTVDTVTYTVGDGTTEFGDFNGASGLEDCLQHIELLDNAGGAQAPQKITILLKTSRTSVFNWSVTTAHVLHASRGTCVEIIGRGTGEYARIDCGSVPAGTTMLDVQSGSLTLVNIEVVALITDVIPFACQNRLKIYNCRIRGYEGASTALTLQCDELKGVDIRNSEIRGRIRLDCVEDVIPSVIDNCIINGCIQIAGSFSAGVYNKVFANLTISSSIVYQNASHLFGRGGAIEAIGIRNLALEGTTVSWHNDQDGLHLDSSVAIGLPRDIHVKGCLFYPNTAGTHAVGAGSNGADGTGWGIYCDQGQKLFVSNCRFGNTNRSSADVPYTARASIDGGGIRFQRCKQWHIATSAFDNLFHANAGTETVTAIAAEHSSLHDCEGATINGCSFGDWEGGTMTRSRGIRLIFQQNILITGCYLSGSSVASRAAGADALRIEDCESINISGSTFENWAPGEGNPRCINFDGTNAKYISVTGCFFRSNGDYPINTTGMANPIEGSVFNSNTFYAGHVNEHGMWLESAIDCVANGNAFIFATAKVGISWGTGTSVNCVCMGNGGSNLRIYDGGGTPGNPRGYDEGNSIAAFTGIDYNLVNSYI